MAAAARVSGSSMAALNCKMPASLLLAGMVLALLLLVDESVLAAPILLTSLGSCEPVALNSLPGAPPRFLDCCLPAPTRDPIFFKFPKFKKPRVRKPIHVLAKDLNYVRKYNLAYARMKALPDSDPRSFAAQWKVHCSFCNPVFQQRQAPAGNVTGVDVQVHFTWTFLPWHRMYLYFHERILGSLINDPTFALPFWNWDNTLVPDAPTINPMYLPGFPIDNTALYALRIPIHLPPAAMDLAFDPETDSQVLTFDQVRDQNLGLMYKHVTNVVGFKLFGGGAVRAGEAVSSAGMMEDVHGVAHRWTGYYNDSQFPDNEDMGRFTFSGRDPLFYTHHANVDRLWDVWKTLPDTQTRGRRRRRQDPDDPDFLNSYYTFYDENQDFVYVKVADTLRSWKLGYEYTNMSESDQLWIDFRPFPPGPPSQPWFPTDFPEALPGGSYSLTSDTPATYRVRRRVPTEDDVAREQAATVDELEESVVIKSVVVPRSLYVRMDVFVNYPDANVRTPLYIAAFVGSFVQLPEGIEMSLSARQNQILDMRFSVDSALQDLGVTDDTEDIIVTIVTKGVARSTSFPFTGIAQAFD